MHIPKKGKILIVLGFLFSGISISCLFAASRIETVTYKNYTGISFATDALQKKQSYMKAITLCPEKPNAYTLLLDIYREDGIFAQQESEEFLGLYNKNHNKFRKSKEYAQLHYQAGLLYANSYEGSSSTRMRMAASFFNEAEKTMSKKDINRSIVECYYSICTFYSNYIWNSVREISSEQINSLINDIQTTVSNFIEDDNIENTYSKLGFFVAVCDLLYDQRDVIASMVDEKSVFNILDSIYQELPESQLIQKEESKKLAQILSDNEGTYRDMIERAYERGGGQ